MLAPTRSSLILAGCVLALAGSHPSAALPAGFVQGWHEVLGASSHALALGDIDADGDVDAYVSDFYDRDAIWVNEGDGTFHRSLQLLDSGYGSCVQLAPLDGDASLDLWLTRHLDTNRVWLNDGSGVLADSSQSLGGSASRVGCALGDLDGDGDLDAYVPTDNNTISNEIYFNNGSGAFTSSGQALGNYFSRAVALGDVDGDGDLDAMIGNNGTNRLWKNNGSGVFSNSGAAIGSGGTFGVALGDLDGDSDLDVFFANGSSSGDPEQVWLNDGSGVFTNSGQSLGNDYSFSVVLFDCDGDSDLDAFVGNNTGVPNQLYLNGGNGVFTASGQALGLGGSISVAARDLDGDLDVDLFLANVEQPEQVFLNDGDCHFTPSGQLLGSSAAESVTLGDIDHDGDGDVIVGTYGGIVRVLRNDGTGTYVDDDQWLSPGFGPTANEVRLADFDGDSDLDLWVGFCCVGAGFTDDPADRIYWNDGSGHFSDSGQLLGSEYTTGGAVGDVDGDGDLDIVTSSYHSLFSLGENRLYLNDGAGQFSQSLQALGNGDFVAVGMADLDGDSDLDLFFGAQNGGSRVFLNGGGGSFSDTGQSLGSATVYAVALGDIDGDGDRDAFLGNNGANTVWVNDGSGHFSDSGQSLGTYASYSVHLFDADGDGDLDAWTTSGGGFSCQPNQLWLNNGAGVFSDSGWALGCLGFGRSAMSDLDRDGDLDLFIGSFQGDHQVWWNQLRGPVFSDGFEGGTTGAWSSTTP